jgi:hypothetical protein
MAQITGSRSVNQDPKSSRLWGDFGLIIYWGTIERICQTCRFAMLPPTQSKHLIAKVSAKMSGPFRDTSHVQLLICIGDHRSHYLYGQEVNPDNANRVLADVTV